MTLEELKPTGLLNSAAELRQLILDNPGLPLLVFAGEDANAGGDYPYMSCSRVSAYVGEFLDCRQTVNKRKCYCERDDFQEDLESAHSDFDGSDREFEEFIENEMMKYEPNWKPCIILSVDN